MPEPLNTSTYVDLSTRYITQQDNDLLSGDATGNYDGPIVHEYEYGFFVPVIADNWEERSLAFKARGYSQDFIDLYERCIREGIRLIRIDRDGDEQPLPEHEW